MWTSDPLTDVQCRPRSEIDQPSTTAVLCTLGPLGPLFLTVLLGIVVHINIDGYSVFSFSQEDYREIERECNDEASISSDSTLVLQPQSHLITPLTCDTPAQGDDIPNPFTHNFCITHPSPSIRITRLILATLLYIPLLTFFILPMRWFTRPRYVLISRFTPRFLGSCHQFYSIQPSVQEYVGVVFFEIIPFICGTFAFLRSAVDVILWKCGRGRRGLSYELEVGGWWVCMPIVGFVLGVAGVWLGVVKWGMGVKRERDVEAQEEEEMGLMHGVGEGDDDADGPPPYEQVVEERQKEVKDLV